MEITEKLIFQKQHLKISHLYCSYKINLSVSIRFYLSVYAKRRKKTLKLIEVMQRHIVCISSSPSTPLPVFNSLLYFIKFATTPLAVIVRIKLKRI